MTANPRTHLVAPISLALLLAQGCAHADTEAEDPVGGGPDAAAAQADAPGAPDAALPDVDAAVIPDATATAEAPRIVQVEWEWLNCDLTTDLPLSVQIKATVDDPDTDPAVLTYDGAITGCGTFDGNPATVPCDGSTIDPDAQPQPVPVDHVTLTVADPQGGQDTVAFTAPNCTAGLWEAP